jgi:chromosome segregation ATPase
MTVECDAAAPVAMDVEPAETAEVHRVATDEAKMSGREEEGNEEENPATPAKGTRPPGASSDMPVAAQAEGSAEHPSATGVEAAAAQDSMETPPKSSQADKEAEEGEDEDEDSNEVLGQELYYLLLRFIFKELDLYSHPAEAGLLDPKKQMLVYHHAARLFDLRADVLGALNGDLTLTANLPVAFQKVARKLRRKLQDQGQVERLTELTERHVFGHDHAIRFVESNLPKGAKEHCVWLREKPHAQSDVVKSISPFRDVIKFHCFRNPLMLIEDHSMGLAITVEKVFPVAYLVVSPFLRKPEALVKAISAGGNWQRIDDELSEHLINFVSNDIEGWRSFVQRRADVISKGSLQIIQRALRLKPKVEGLDDNAAHALEDLQEEVEILREKARKAEETAMKLVGKENMSLEGKLSKSENKMIDLRIVAEQIHAEKLRMSKEVDNRIELQKTLEVRADAAEKAVVDQREEQENLRRRTLEAEERRQAAISAKIVAEQAREEAKEAMVEMEEQARTKSNEAELLAGGVHEMMVEFKKSEASKKRAIMHAKEVQTKVRDLTTEVSRLEKTKEAMEKHVQEEADKAAQAKEMLELQAKEAVDKAAQAEERAADAKQKENAAVATLQLKTEAVEQIRASNVALRAEAAMATERVAAIEAATEADRVEADRARKELQGRDDEIKHLSGVIEEQKQFVASAEMRVEEEKALTQEAERKAAEACQAEMEMVAKVKVHGERIETLNIECATMRAEVAKLTETAGQEYDRAEAAEQALEQAAEKAAQAAKENSAQLEVKTRTVESLMASNVELRTEVVAAKSDAEQAQDQVKIHEAERSKAKESEAVAHAQLQEKDEELKLLLGSIDEHNELIVAAKAEVDAANQERKEAEQKMQEARKSQVEIAAQMKVKNHEIEHMTTSCGTLKGEVDKLTEALEQECARVAEAEAATNSVKGLLEVKVRTIETMTADSTALRVSLISAKEKAEKAAEVASDAEAAASKARESEKSARLELKPKIDEICGLETAMANLRAEREPSDVLKDEMAKVRAEGAECDRQAAESAKLAAEARDREAEVSARMALKAKEISGLVDECAALRSEADQLKEHVKQAEEIAEEARRAETATRTTLQFKTDDIERVCAANVELRAEILGAKTRAEEAETRAETARKNADAQVSAAHRARDQAHAELRGKVAAAESMAASMGKVRAEAEAARSAEAAALDVAKRGNEALASAEKAMKEVKKIESKAAAQLQVKIEEASRLSEECGALRSEVALLRGKSEASGSVVKALAATCDKLRSELAASQAKHDWSKLQEPVPNFASPPKQSSDITLEELELALTRPCEVADNSGAHGAVGLFQAAAGAVSRRLFGKGPASRLREPSSEQAVAAEVETSAPVEQAKSSRRGRSKTPEPPVQKRARVAGSTESSKTAHEEVSAHVDPSEAIDAD